ncbi:unnamed protein product, partial [Sphacelaria rigidula]
EQVPFRAVYLNGLAQTDDGTAMRELVQQLGITGQRVATYSSNLEMAVESMRTGAVNGVPVVFVLDHFEQFSTRKPQTLLYALLDLCQDKRICAAVVGLSVNLNVLDAAEKRIKSRFSFRQIRFPPLSFDTLLAVLEEALTVPITPAEGSSEQPVVAREDASEDRGIPRDDAVSCLVPGVSTSFAREFNSIMRQASANPFFLFCVCAFNNTGGGGAVRLRTSGSNAGAATADLRALAASGRSVDWFFKLASTAISLLREGQDRGLTRAAFVRAGEMLEPDSHTQALRSVSVTQVEYIS